MSAAKKPSARQELENIEAALVDSILNSRESDLRHELSSEGIDCAQIINEIDEIILSAKSAAAKEAFDRAKAGLAHWRNRGAFLGADNNGQQSIERLVQLRDGGPDLSQKMLLAARKAKQHMSDDDLRGLSSDLEDLERLERETEDF